MYKLTVPLVAQAKNSTCWHASAKMIWLFSQLNSGREGPMHTLNNKWVANDTINPTEFIKLANNVGLTALSGVNHTNHTESSLKELLKKHGPIWCAGHWYGPGHIVVLTGVDSKLVFINDPNKGIKKTQSLAWFNQQLDSQILGCMMVKDSNSY